MKPTAVVSAEPYGASVPLELHARAFGVLELPIVEVLSVDVREIEPLPPPAREVPIFAYCVEPRVEVAAELESQIRALSFTTAGEQDQRS